MDKNNQEYGMAIISGGMDSVTMLYDFRETIKMIVCFNYGSKHNQKEIPFAIYHAKLLQIPFETIDLLFINKLFKSSLLKSGGLIPDGHYEDKSMKKTVVPFRNGIMLSIAAGLAESQGLTCLFMANHAGDHAIYPDCRDTFILPMAQAIEQGTYSGIQLISPYLTLTKREIAVRGRELRVDYSKTWSCYKGEEFHCGTCGTCVERKEALLGFDLTEYQQ